MSMPITQVATTAKQHITGTAMIVLLFDFIFLPPHIGLLYHIINMHDGHCQPHRVEKTSMNADKTRDTWTWSTQKALHCHNIVMFGARFERLYGCSQKTMPV
jgi:hypothetical protein